MAALTPDEAGIIKTMLALRPKLEKQDILSYFTRPGRHINHARISEVDDGTLHPAAPPAPLQATLAYMAARAALLYPDASQFIIGAVTPAPSFGVVASLHVTWWPVGQGLFMTGRLAGVRGGQFNWVYDCGSTSGAAERDNAIRVYKRDLNAQKIDLVTLSHFDSDHINGIVELIKGVRVRTLLLPYVPLWQRLLIAIGQGVTEADSLFGFYIDPAGYLASIEGGEVDEIVFVPPAGPDDIVPAPEEAPDPIFPIEGGKPEYGAPPAESDGDPALSVASNVQVRFLRPRGRVVVSSLWEFVPYNDATMQPLATTTFVDRATRVAKFLLNNPTRRKAALATLKRVYQRAFGTGPGPANLISLFLYSGPIGSRARFDTVAATASFDRRSGQDNLGQLSTGDGYLDTPPRLHALQRFYSGGNRLDRAGLVQIMHHGARSNWQPGLGAIFKPAASIFSSDPGYSHCHPHAEVLRDFWSWHPVRVDKSLGFALVAVLQVP